MNLFKIFNLNFSKTLNFFPVTYLEHRNFNTMAAIRYLNKNSNRLSDFEYFIQGIPREEHSVHTLDIHRHELTRL